MGAAGIIVKGDGSTGSLIGTPGSDTFAGTFRGESFFTGLGDDDVYASGGNDFVYADLGNDFLDGGAGIDTLSFGAVNSSFNTEAPGFSVNVDLQKHFQDLGYFGRDTIYAFENVDGTPLNDTIRGDGLSNFLSGSFGDDLLDGRDGVDTLNGGEGNDTLIGGTGDDVLFGGSGKDRFYSGTGADVLNGSFSGNITDDGGRDLFIFTSTGYSPSSTTRDTIYGFFEGATGDKIDLTRIDANGATSGEGKFSYIGANSIGSNSTSQVQVRATAVDNQYLVRVDTDKDSSAEMQILVYSASALTSSDFIL